MSFERKSGIVYHVEKTRLPHSESRNGMSSFLDNRTERVKNMNCSKVGTVFGQLTFLALMIAQCLLLASYPAKYQNDSSWYAFLLFITPAFGISWWRMNSDERKDSQLFYIWFTYAWLGLVPMVGIVFGLTAEELNRNKQFGPNELKIALSITPVMLLLFLNTLADTARRGEIAVFSFKMTVDLFDGNELLQNVIDENVENFGIPRSLIRALIAFACITFLLSPLEMAAHLLSEDEDNRKGWVGLNAIIQVFHNLILFGLRVGIWLGDGWNFSMFTVKNVIMICVRCLECASAFCVEEDADQEHSAAQPNAPPPPAQNPAFAIDYILRGLATRKRSILKTCWKCKNRTLASTFLMSKALI